MNEEDFACDSFTPQRWRQDVCRKCYQSKRLHDKKTSSPPCAHKTERTPVLSSPSSAITSGNDRSQGGKRSRRPSGSETSSACERSSSLSRSAPSGSAPLHDVQAVLGTVSQTLPGAVTREAGTSPTTDEETPSTFQPSPQPEKQSSNIPLKPSPPALSLHHHRQPLAGTPTTTKETTKTVQCAEGEMQESVTEETRSLSELEKVGSFAQELTTDLQLHVGKLDAKQMVASKGTTWQGDDNDVDEMAGDSQTTSCSLSKEEVLSKAVEVNAHTAEQQPPAPLLLLAACADAAVVGTSPSPSEQVLCPSLGPGLSPPPPSPVMGAPPPPPPLPPLTNLPCAVPLRVRVIRPPLVDYQQDGSPSPPQSSSGSDTKEIVKQNELLTGHGLLMQSIRSGVQLRPVPPPQPRNPSEIKVFDVASELQERMLKKQKEQLDKASRQLSLHSTTALEIREQIYRMRGTPTYLHHLASMMERIKTFLNTCEISVEVLEKRCGWPSHLIADLEFVLNFMDGLAAKICEVEKVCHRTMELKAQQLNVDIVQRCVGEVIRKASQIKTSHDQHTRYSEAFAVFPVDQIDIHRLMRRAAEATEPILDRLYTKALQTHELITDPTLSKFDLNFRLQNAQRQLRMCCRMSDELFANLYLPRHQNYSEAMLKVSELEKQYQQKLAVLERKGSWDEDESVTLHPPQSSKENVKDQRTLVQQIKNALTNGQDLPEDAFGMSEKLYLHCYLDLVREAVRHDNTQAVDAFLALSLRVFTSADVKEKWAFDWLHEAVVKGSHCCIEHMVKVVGLPVNCQSLEAGNSLLHIASRRQDLATMHCLVRVGVDPLLQNNNCRTALSMLALKCFPPQTFPDDELKELPFDLSPYINNESLSDCVLVSSDGDKFHAHKLILCAQSGVFRSMLESEHWAECRQGNQVLLPTVSSQVLKLLLQYLYMGQSTLPHDDLNLWIDLLSAADHYLLERLRLHCEKVLSRKMDAEVVVPMYWAAVQFSASRLVANCSAFMLEHYHEVEDQDHKALLHLLENARIRPRQ